MRRGTHDAFELLAATALLTLAACGKARQARRPSGVTDAMIASAPEWNG